jgi:phenylacetate-CoA ligase
MRSQWWSYEELKELQDKKLRAIVKYAYETIPLYHEKLKNAGVRPEAIKTVEDLVKLPYTTKAEIHANFPDKVIAPQVDINKCWTPRTSGSTGIPLTVVYDEAAEDFEKATALRPNLCCGQGLFDKWIVLTSPHHIKDKKRWFQEFGLFNPISISMFSDFKEQISKIEQIKPDIIDGYSSAIYLLAQEVKKSHTDINPRIVFGTAEFLTEEMRDVINSVFGVEMFDQFGGVEMGRTAWECPEHAGYHIDMDAVVMEFIKDGEQVASGERGEIVYTNLYNYTMPIIRYRIEDVGIPADEKCPCGRGLPLMKLVEGRKDSFIKTPNGRIYPQMTFWSIMRMFSESDKIINFKVIQEKIDVIKIQIVPGRGFTQETINQLKSDIKNVLGEEVHIEVEPVDEIPREAGKVRSVVSKIKIDWNKREGV